MSDQPTLRNRPYIARSEAEALREIGPYRLIRAIGEGGMGMVYLAEQEAPVRRKVAIKVIRSPFQRVEDRIRFQAEQQAMARLQHPNVAQMFEAGTTADGYPFFVMEWLDGESLTDYCDARALPIEKRLDLFLSVCDGVQHAHQKSIIHRDLKPSNILVVEIDGRAIPKIIDFGIAKALDVPLVAAAPTGDNIVGTPAYLCPEAVTGSLRADLDTRADVYALGLVLFKLLAGRQPYELDMPLLESMLLITGDDLPAPHLFFASFDEDERDSVTRQRATTPAALKRILNSDLAAIVQKSVAKNRDHRYGSVSDLQADVRRYLADEPVLASAPNAIDRLRKFVVRNRGAVAATVLVLAALIAGIVARTIEARRAQASQRHAEIVTKFFTQLFDEGIPGNGRTTSFTMNDLLRNGARRADRELADAPLARAEALLAIGRALMHQGDAEVAEPLLRESLALRRKELDPDDPLLAQNYVELGILRARFDLAEGEHFLREAVRIREKSLGPNDPWLANTLADLGDVRRKQKAYGEAEQLIRRSIAIREKVLPPDDPDIGASMSSLARLYIETGRFADAERYLLRGLQLRAKHYGPDHYITSRSYDAMADLRIAQGRWAEAEQWLRKDLPIVERSRGADHKYTAWVRVDLARCLVQQNRAAEAKPMLDRAIPLLRGDAELKDVYQRAVEMRKGME